MTAAADLEQALVDRDRLRADIAELRACIERWMLTGTDDECGAWRDVLEWMNGTGL